jgi:hypothetical protein
MYWVSEFLGWHYNPLYCDNEPPKFEGAEKRLKEHLNAGVRVWI